MQWQLLALGILLFTAAFAGFVLGPLVTDIRRVNGAFRSFAWHVNGAYCVGSLQTKPQVTWQQDGLAAAVSMRRANRGLPFHDGSCSTYGCLGKQFRPG